MLFFYGWKLKIKRRDGLTGIHNIMTEAMVITRCSVKPDSIAMKG